MNAAHITKVQKPIFNIVLTLIGLGIVLLLVNLSIYKFETHLATGEVVLLELAPVDPRGMMQGDYMALEFELAEDIFVAVKKQKNLQETADDRDSIYDYSGDGIAIVNKNARNVGHFVRLIPADNLAKQHLAAGELPIYYRVRNGRVKIATNAFFFQEGHAKAYEAAKYGLFRVNKKGEPLLTDMVTETFEVIKGIDVENDIRANATNNSSDGSFDATN